MVNQTEQVNQFLSQLDHPWKDEIRMVRTIILESNEQITEHIKWNAPSFCYQGEDRVTFNLHPKDRILLILHRGAKTKENPDFKSGIASGLVTWITGDRAKIEFTSKEDVEVKSSELAHTINEWIKSSA